MSETSGLVERYTLSAIEHHDDGVVLEFYRRLREDKKLMTTRCRSCEKIAYPPRPFCPSCHARELDWVEIGEPATLYAFTTQLRALRFVRPDVIGIVELAGVGRMLSKINAPIERLAIGQALRFEPLELAPAWVVASFTPI